MDRVRWSVHAGTTVCRIIIGQFKVNLIAGSVDDETQIRYVPYSIGPFEWSATKPAVSTILNFHSASPEPNGLSTRSLSSDRPGREPSANEVPHARDIRQKPHCAWLPACRTWLGVQLRRQDELTRACDRRDRAADRPWLSAPACGGPTCTPTDEDILTPSH